MGRLPCLQLFAWIIVLVDGLAMRKNILELTESEQRSLVDAMRLLKADNSAGGFQKLAAYHALPATLCPTPGAEKGVACCVHGMPSFPHWHRLYTVQFEDALIQKGATVGVPYWDPTVASSELPDFLFSDEAYDNGANPWASSPIEFESAVVSREFNEEQITEGTWLKKQFLLALEQDHYCEFEVQFEVAHNALHYFLGGSQQHSMAHLHYASYDPAFIPVHSFTDRVLATWQALQKLRPENPHDDKCMTEMMQEPLKPFNYGGEHNLNAKTTKNCTPKDVLDYENNLGYQYDSLAVGGLGTSDLLAYFSEAKSKERVFVLFHLYGVQMSANVTFALCDVNSKCLDAGVFYVLGGTAEMPWRFHHPYKYEVTDFFPDEMKADVSKYSVKVTVTAQDGTVVPGVDLQPSIVTVPASVPKP